MPNSLSLASVIEKNKVSSGVTYLMLLEIQLKDTDTGLITDTLYLANNDEDVTYNLTVYQAQPFDAILNYEVGSMPEVTISMVDLQKVLLTELNNLSGATGSEAFLRVVRSDALSDDPDLEEVYEITNSRANAFSISLTLGAANQLAKRFPRRTQLRDRCAWKYKSAECGYVGAMGTCDLSLQGANGCAAHSNTVNYGGFPNLVSRAIRG